MTALAPHLTAFLREHLPHERRASPHTCAAYAYSFQLLLSFAAARLRTTPSSIQIEQLDPPLILAFLEYIEDGRGNSARTRNARLAAIKAFFRFLEYRLPSCLDQARRTRALPMKKVDETLVSHLTREEMQALLDAPDPCRVSGLRDRAMLHLAFAAGLRVSELVSLRTDQIDRQAAASIHVMLGAGLEEALDIAARGEMLALGAYDDDAHAVIFIKCLEDEAELIAGTHRDHVVGRPREDDVGALVLGIEPNVEAVEFGEARIGEGHDPMILRR